MWYLLLRLQMSVWIVPLDRRQKKLKWNEKKTATTKLWHCDELQSDSFSALKLPPNSLCALLNSPKTHPSVLAFRNQDAYKFVWKGVLVCLRLKDSVNECIAQQKCTCNENRENHQTTAHRIENVTQRRDSANVHVYKIPNTSQCRHNACTLCVSVSIWPPKRRLHFWHTNTSAN